MVVAETIAGLGIFKSLYDFAKALKDMNDAVVRNGAVIELQEKILAAREAQTALLERIGTLEKEVADLKAWDTDKQRYKLTDLGTSLPAYALKEAMENGEPPHYLCAQCYNNNIKSILQTEVRSPGRCQVLTCHRCGSDLYLSGSPAPEHFKNRQRR